MSLQNFTEERVNIKPGLWTSQLDEQKAVQGCCEYSQLQCSVTGQLYWVEFDPAKGEGNILHRSTPRGIERLTPPGFSVRSRVHEYGGFSWCLVGNSIAFVNENDQEIYTQHLGFESEPQQLTQSPTSRFVEPIWDAHRDRLIVIEEQHLAAGVINRLVAVSLSNGSITLLHQSDDFYAYPVLSNDSASLAFISWIHPFQPWTSTQLYLARFDQQGCFAECLTVAGNEKEESLSQPFFNRNDELLVISDRSGWWNIHRYNRINRELENILPMDAEQMSAPWNMGLRHYTELADGRLASVAIMQSQSRLCLQGQGLVVGKNCYFADLCASGSVMYCVAAANDSLPAIISVTPEGDSKVITGGKKPLSKEECSLPVSISFGEREQQVHGFFYPPCNADFELSTKPPLVIFLHGGPTAACYPILNLKIQYWTQRGFAVLDLNYRGSSNHGRAYRMALKHRWGCSEVEDIEQAVKGLIEAGQVDPNGIFIRGNSSGGYSALNALCELDLFTAGASLYGVSDPLALSDDTHKFESYYLHWLIGDPVGDIRRFEEYSPLHKASKISCPVIFFQGEKDRVVVPEQTAKMAQSLLASGVHVETHLFSDEGHGFRNMENLMLVLRDELQFYQGFLDDSQSSTNLR